MATMAPVVACPLTDMAAHKSAFMGGGAPQQCQAEPVARLGVCSSRKISMAVNEAAGSLQKRSEVRMQKGRGRVLGRRLMVAVAKAAATDDAEGVAGAAGDSVVGEVAVLEEEPETPGVAGPGTGGKARGPGRLQRGGTLSGAAALGKDPSASTVAGKGASNLELGGVFEDPRWVKGTWDLSAFTKNEKVDWDSVIDAEVKRRKWLEENPEASSHDEPVVFDTSIIPWWAWVKRFHLPEAELLNGRAAMVGYFAAYVIDSLTGVGLVDQQNSFLGKLLLFLSVLGVLLVRKTDDIETLKTLVSESTFYDKQWQATWKNSEQPEKPNSE